MSIPRLTPSLVAFVTAVILAPTVHAQLFKPFEFPPMESDLQFFAPADVDTFGGGPQGKTGWFAAYDRVYMNVQRPKAPSPYEQSDKMGDFTWGNRIDVGYVGDDDKGWLATFWHVDGPNVTNNLLVERINRFVEDASPLGEDGVVVHPWRDNNLRLTGDRDYIVQNSINVADMTGFEMNRTWLKPQLMHGARLTPFAGFRYLKFIDFYQRDDYLRYDENGNLLPNLAPPIVTLEATTEELMSLQSGFTNELVGGQLGIRWDKDYRRWNFSGDVKALVFQNFQNFNDVLKIERTIYGDTVPGDDAPTTVLYTENGTAAHAQEVVYGMEIRAEAAYRVTRDFSLNVGFTFLDLARGIGRGINPIDNDQDVLMYGVTFGGTYNR